MASEFDRRRFAWRDQVFEDETLSALALRAAHRIVSKYISEEKGYAWPSLPFLADALRCSSRGAQKAMAQLVSRGHLSVQPGHGPGQANRYRLRLKGDEKTNARSSNNTNASSSLDDEKTNASSPQNDERQFGGSTNASSFKGRTRVRPTPINNPAKESSERDISPGLFGSDEGQTRDAQPAETFESWWKQYPRHAAKDNARRAYKRVIEKRLATAPELLAGAMRYAAERSGQDPRFTKHPATWLNGGCWADEAAPAPAGGGPIIDEAGNDLTPALQGRRPAGPMSNLEIALRGGRR